MKHITLITVFFFLWPLVGTGQDAQPQHTLPATYQWEIKGQVYADHNGNGEHDRKEPFLEGIAVSDGRGIVLTNEKGEFLFSNKDKQAKMVFVSVPSGYEKGGEGFYRFLGDETEGVECHFGLRPEKRPGDNEFSFIQLTDVHINGADNLDQWRRELEEASLTDPAPNFMVVTGDLVGKGDNLEQMETYRAGLSASKVPVYNVCGNHDRCKGDDRVIAYNRFFGPDYYSFTEGEHHFVVLNNTVDNSFEKEWLKQDLEILGTGKTIHAFQHYPPYEDTYKELEEMGIDYVYSGHWHSSKITPMGDLMCLNTPSFSFGGIDLSPSGFRRVVVKGDRVESEYRPNGVKDFFQVESPMEGQRFSPPDLPLPLCVNYYTSTKTEVNLRVRVTGEQVDRTMVLEKLNPLSWVCMDAFEGLPDGDYTFEVFDDSLTVLHRQSLAIGVDPFDEFGEPKKAPSSQWPGFLGGPEKQGHADSVFDGSIEPVWASPTGGMPGLGSPVVGDGKVFVPVRSFDFPGKNGLEVFDALTGERLWFYATDSAVNHSAALVDNLVIFQEMAGRVYALNGETGEKVWQYDCGDFGFRWLYSAPLIWEGDVYVGSAKWMARLNAGTGEEVWSCRNGGDWISTWSPLSTNGKVVTNSLNWRKDVGDFAGVYALDLATGDLVWNAECIGSHSGVTFFDDKACFTDIRSGFHVIDAATGEQLWHKELVDGSGKWKNCWSATTPIVIGDVAIAGTGEGTLYGLDLAEKKVLWEFKAEDSLLRCSAYQRDYCSLFSSPLFSHGIVYIGSGDGHVYGIWKDSGKVVFKYNLRVPVLSTPVIVDKMMYVMTMDGMVYAFESLGRYF